MGGRDAENVRQPSFLESAGEAPEENGPTDFWLPPTLTIIGGSMAPTIPAGSVVSASPRVEPVKPGDVVVIRGRTALIVHRVVHTASVFGQGLVYHRGDLEGGIGIARSESVAGHVVGIVKPVPAPVPAIAKLNRRFRLRFAAARLRCRTDARCRVVACSIGLDRFEVFRRFGRCFSSRLL